MQLSLDFTKQKQRERGRKEGKKAVQLYSAQSRVPLKSLQVLFWGNARGKRRVSKCHIQSECQIPDWPFPDSSPILVFAKAVMLQKRFLTEIHKPTSSSSFLRLPLCFSVWLYIDDTMTLTNSSPSPA